MVNMGRAMWDPAGFSFVVSPCCVIYKSPFEVKLGKLQTKSREVLKFMC